MQYQSLTQDEQDQAIAAALHSREVEHFHYALNAANYDAMLAEPSLKELPDEWPEEIKTHRGKKRDQIVAQVADPKQRDMALLLVARDHLRHLRECERHEIGNVERIYAALDAKLPAERKTKALAAAKVAREAQKGIGK